MTRSIVPVLLFLLALTQQHGSARSSPSAEDHAVTTASSASTPSLRPPKSRQLSLKSLFGCGGNHCREVTPLDEASFDIDKYVEKSWYIQKQQLNPYQSINDLYCVVATYNKRDDGFIQVLNTANVGSVQGGSQAPIDPNGCQITQLCAQQINAGQIQVAPCLFQPVFGLAAGPYWVIAVGDDYSWAIVSAGQPKVEKEEVNGTTFCTTKGEGNGIGFLDVNGAGLWLFSRNPVYNATEISIMETKLTEMGIYTGDLKDVVHSGCTYPDFVKV